MSHADTDRLLAEFASDEPPASGRFKDVDNLGSAVEGGPSKEPPGPFRSNSAASAKALKRGLNYSHEAMIDFIICHPGISQNDIASHFGYTPTSISTIMAGDAFQSQLAKRREEIVDPLLKATVEEKFKGIAGRAADIIMAKLDQPMDKISDQFALKSLEIAAKAAGYGARVDLPPTSTTEVHVHLETLGKNLDNLLTRRKAAVETIDAEVQVKALPFDA